MRRCLVALLLLACLHAPAFAQSNLSGPVVVVGFPGVPTGACSTLQLAVNTTNGNLYTCNSGTWTLVSGGGGGPTLQTNGTNNTSQTTLNLQTSAATNGLTLTETNVSAGNVQLGLTGTLTNAGLTNSSTTVNTNACALGSSCTVLVNQLGAAGGSSTLANGNNPLIWNNAQTTDAQAGMTFGETSAATGGTITNGLANQFELGVSTASNSTAAPLNVTQGSITNTVATPLAQFQGTWNNASLVGQGIVENITNTSSSASSLLMNLKVGNTSQFQVGANGKLTMVSGIIVTTGGSVNLQGPAGGPDVIITQEGSGAVNVGLRIQQFSGGAADLLDLTTSGAAVLTSFGFAGAVTKYNNVATLLDGVESITGAPAATTTGATINTANILASTVASETLYRFGYALYQAAAGSGGTCSTNSVVAVTLGWTDNSGTAQTKVFASLNVGPTLAAGAFQNGEVVMLIKASTAITYAMSYTNGNCTTQPTVKIQPYAEAF